MDQLRESDSSAVHRHHGKFHMSRCKGVSPLHDKLHSETSAVYSTLRDAERACQDAEDAASGAMGVMGRAEEGVENAIRDIDAEAARLDRTEPGLYVQRTLFPNGFGEVIRPEGRAQLDPLPALRVDLELFKSKGAMGDKIDAFEAAETSFREAISASEAADVAVEMRFAEELAARRAMREQLASSYGRLRDFYRSRPKIAERFFLKDRRARRVKKPPVAAVAGNGVAPAPA
jgi:hypothetical protein